MIYVDYVKELRKYTGPQRIILNCAGVLIIKEDKVLLQLREDNHKWGLIGGLLELGETYACAAIREAKEETGLDVKLKSFLGIFHHYHMVWANGDTAHTIGVYYEAEAIGGTLRCDEESLELRYFPLDDLPELFAEDHVAAIEAYKQGTRLPIPEENREKNR